MRHFLASGIIIALLCLLQGCGSKGPLSMPQQSNANSYLTHTSHHE